jgi:hypothetical protein
MSAKVHEIPLEGWPQSLGFVPFVGAKYEEGLEGARVMLLGESHYREEGADNCSGVTRAFTRDVFGSLETPVRKPGDGRYFPPLDRILTGKERPSLEESAAAWERISFANLVQEFAGERPGQRPTSRQFKEGAERIMDAIDVLKPDVILALGRATWNSFTRGDFRNDLPSLDVEVRGHYARLRRVWGVPYAGGGALMSWVYHPSRAIDPWQNGFKVLRHLISLHQR